MKIAITTSSFGQFSDIPLQLLQKHEFEIVLNPYGRALSEAEAIEVISGCVGVAAGTEPLNASVLAALPELKVISRCGTGQDNVDLEYAKKHGIKTYFTPDAPTMAVAELTVGLAFNLCRQIGMMDRKLHAGVWKKSMGSLLSEKRVGIIGYGRIGRKVAGLFAALGCKVACHDPFLQEADIPLMPLDDLLGWCDCLTLHVPKQADGKTLIGTEQLKKLKKGALVVNTARGGLIDETALYEALKSGHLGGAAVDVFTKEPYSGPLAELDNIILTPHIGSYAHEARIRMELETIENLLTGLGLSII